MRAILILAAALLPSTAFAAAADFKKCDGYDAPNKKADGITTTSLWFGLGSGASDFRRNQSTFGSAGIDACDQALADPLLLPRYWVRQAHLLQAKAMHLLLEKDFEAAIATLAKSDAVTSAGGDSRISESIGLGNRALRSLALVNLARRDEAEIELKAIAEARPYAAGIRRMVRSIRLSGSPKMDAIVTALKTDAFLEPSLMKSLFLIDMINAKFEEAIELYPDISFDLPRGKGESYIKGFADRKYQEISDRTTFAGALFYALNAVGRSSEAAKVLAAARTEVDAATAPPPEPEKGRKLSRSVQVDYQKRLAAGADARKALASWTLAAALRATASESSLLQLLETIKEKKLAELPVVVDLLAQVKTNGPEEDALVKELVETLQQSLERELQTTFRLDLKELVALLPRPESEVNKGKFRSALPEFLLETSGMSIRPGDAPGEISITYRTVVGTDVMSDELGLLAAAVQTQKAGKDSFVVQSRMAVVRTLSACSYGCGPAMPDGYESRISILPVDSASVSKDRRWRLINAKDLYEHLAPKYIAAQSK